MTEETEFEGIAGWLVLVAIGIVITPHRIGLLVITTYPEIFSSGAWDVVTTPGYDAYHPLWGPTIIVELSINCALALVWLFMGFKFFTKSRDFPKWFVGVAIFTLIFVIADTLVIKILMPNESSLDPETLQELGRAIVMVVVWVPYMLISKRVKQTFAS